ncbi:unnamed protein product [Didymodactylos carnosus]|uniref:Uncharacterized protein n=1 Tax=Didymodactylos carnosus TaxID=1234261 RepID=A0A8S2ETS5_9BILA|nr:unnamed protein product [Didymodactylos carnosus]CAF4065000.1 unnamed protein product [Didymodactylos carnosus]
MGQDGPENGIRSKTIYIPSRDIEGSINTTNQNAQTRELNDTLVKARADQLNSILKAHRSQFLTRELDRVLRQVIRGTLKIVDQAVVQSTKKISKAESVYEIHHMPPASCYAGTPYEKISRYDMPAILMHKEDHRAILSTGSSTEGKEHRKQTHEPMRNGHMSVAIEVTLNNTKNTAKESEPYAKHTNQYLDYVATKSVTKRPRKRR